jgi:hypothetical protein
LAGIELGPGAGHRQIGGFEADGETYTVLVAIESSCKVFTIATDGIMAVPASPVAGKEVGPAGRWESEL